MKASVKKPSMRIALLITLLIVSLAAIAQPIPDLKLPVFVSHLSGANKALLRRPGCPKHNFISKTVCLKYKCRAVVGWKQTQQRNKFKRYKKGPAIPRLKYLQMDSLRRIQKQQAPIVQDTPVVIAALSQPISKDSTVTFGLNDVLFETYSTDLKETFTKHLDSLSAFIRQHESYHIGIVGHTDNSGNERSNLKLSRDRAGSVAQYLVSTGIDPRMITAEGRGSEEPIANNATAEGREKNRRVEIFLSFH